MTYWEFDPDKLTRKLTLVAPKRYPKRIWRKNWNVDTGLVGKAIARGWAVPCRYYPLMRGRGRPYVSFVYPGISDEEYLYILAIMEGKKIA